MRKKFWLLLLIISVIAVILLSFVLRPAQEEQEFITEPVKRGNIDLIASASGYLEPAASFNVTPRISSKVISVDVKEGDRVTKGQQLALLDDSDLASAVKSAQYNFNSAVYSRDQLKNAPVVDDYAVKRAQQQVNLTAVTLEQAKKALENAKLIAPVEGKVIAVNIKAEEYTTLSSLVPAFIIGDTDNLEASLDVNELDVAKLKPGQLVRLNIDAVGRVVESSIIKIAESGTNVAGIVYFETRALITDQTELKSNMSVAADIIISSKENVLVIPAAALQTRDGRNIVRVAELDASGNIVATEKEVEVGINNNTTAEIISGLEEGENVIVNFNVRAGNGSAFGF